MSFDFLVMNQIRRDFNELFRWLHGQRYESTTKLFALAVVKAEKRSGGSHFTSVFGAVKLKLLRELGTDQMH